MSSRRFRAGLIATFVLAGGLVQAPAHGMPGASPGGDPGSAVVVQATVATPGAPRIGVPRPGNRSAVAYWAAPSEDGGSAISGYVVRVYRGSTLVKATAAKASARRLTVTGLTNGVTYTLNVSARSAVGTGTPSARSAEVTPVGAPGSPRLGKPTTGNRAAVVRWAAPASDGGAPITGYVIRAYRGKTLVRTVNASASARRATVTGLTNGVPHTLTISARNAKGVGTPSARSSAVTPSARAPKPAPRPAPKAAPRPAPATYYANCDAVRAAGAAPIRRGQPGYSTKLDRDGDGVGCER
ncbi:fibronectin type III domain-containing protein [Blastococcus sp. SYSU DS0617]